MNEKSLHLPKVNPFIYMHFILQSQELCSILSPEHKFHFPPLIGFLFAHKCSIVYSHLKKKKILYTLFVHLVTAQSMSLSEVRHNFSKDLFASTWSLRASITTIPLKLLYSRIMNTSMLINFMAIWFIFNPNFTQLLSRFGIDIPSFLKYFILFSFKTLHIFSFYFTFLFSFQTCLLHFLLLSIK